MLIYVLHYYKNKLKTQLSLQWVFNASVAASSRVSFASESEIPSAAEERVAHPPSQAPNVAF